MTIQVSIPKPKNAKKPKTIPPVRPNAGVEAEYQRKLLAFVDEMHRSIAFGVKATYRAASPEMAQDAHWTDGMSPAKASRATMKRLSARWMKRIDGLAPEMAAWFAIASKDRVDSTLKSSLKKSGFAIEWKMTRECNDVLQATIGEQVGLIKSIASQHLAEVEGLVMRSVAAGRDIGTLADELQKRHGLTRHRAVLIAHDQNNKATATMMRVRQTQIGIKEAIWVHSTAKRRPRLSHVKASQDKLIYDVDKGAFIDGAWIYPGELINCGCSCRSIIPWMESKR